MMDVVWLTFVTACFVSLLFLIRLMTSLQGES
jgi:hypothetical protein